MLKWRKIPYNQSIQYVDPNQYAMNRIQGHGRNTENEIDKMTDTGLKILFDYTFVDIC